MRCRSCFYLSVAFDKSPVSVGSNCLGAVVVGANVAGAVEVGAVVETGGNSPVQLIFISSAWMRCKMLSCLGVAPGYQASG